MWVPIRKNWNMAKCVNRSLPLKFNCFTLICIFVWPDLLLVHWKLASGLTNGLPIDKIICRLAFVIGKNFAVSDGNNDTCTDRNYANNNKMNSRLKARQFQFTQPPINDLTGESCKYLRGGKNFLCLLR